MIKKIFLLISLLIVLNIAGHNNCMAKQYSLHYDRPPISTKNQVADNYMKMVLKNTPPKDTVHYYTLAIDSIDNVNPTEDDLLLKAWMYFIVGTEYRKEGCLGSSLIRPDYILKEIEAYKNCISLLRQINLMDNSDFGFTATYLLANAYSNISLYSDAEKTYRELLSIKTTESIVYSFIKATAYRIIADFERKNGNYDEARKNYNNVIIMIKTSEFYEYRKPTELLDMSYLGLSNVYLKTDSPLLALDALNYILKNNHLPNADPSTRACLYSNLGLIYFRNNDFKLAKKYYEKAIKYYIMSIQYPVKRLYLSDNFESERHKACENLLVIYKSINEKQEKINKIQNYLKFAIN